MVAVTPLAPEDACQYQQALDWPFPILADSERFTYRLYGLERGTLLQLFHPAVWMAYGRLMRRGQRLRRPDARDDWRQLGGDVLIDPGGIIRQIHYSRTPADRPDLARWIPSDLLADR